MCDIPELFVCLLGTILFVCLLVSSRVKFIRVPKLFVQMYSYAKFICVPSDVFVCLLVSFGHNVCRVAKTHRMHDLDRSFSAKEPMNIGSFVKRDLQIKSSFAFAPPFRYYSCALCLCVCVCVDTTAGNCVFYSHLHMWREPWRSKLIRDVLQRVLQRRVSWHKSMKK